MESTPQQTLEDLVTALAEIELALQASGARAMLRQSDDLKQAILACLPPTDPTEDVALSGHGVTVTFGPVPQIQTITNKKRLKRLLGSDTFDMLATFSIKALEAYLNQDQLARISEKHPGTRRFKEAKKLEP